MAIDPLGALLLGGAGFFTGQAANKALVDTSRLDREAQARNQDKALAALQGSDAFQTTTRNAAGGFDVSQPGGPNARKAREELAKVDATIRAPGINAADRNFNFKLPTLADARGIVEQENSLNQATLDKGLSDIALLKRRQFGGIENTGEGGSTVDAMARFANENRRGSERDALDLFNKSAAADISLKDAIKNSLARQAPAPPFSSGGPGGTAANAIVQSPPRAAVPDLSAAIGPQSVGGVVKYLMDQEQARENNKNFLAALERLRPQVVNPRGGVI